MLLWQRVNFGDVCSRPQERTLLFALAFDNQYNNREAAFKRYNTANGVIIRPIISEFTLLKRAIFDAMRPKFDYRSSFVILAF